MGQIINNIALAAPEPNRFRHDNFIAPHTRYGGTMSFRWKTGRLQIPVAAPGDPTGQGPRTPAVVVLTHAPYGQLLIRWTAERDGAKPVLPDPRPPTGGGLDLLDCEITPEPPQLNDDGQNYTYRASGWALYSCTVPIWVMDSLPMGCLPNDVTGSANFFLTQADFSADVLPLSRVGLGRVN